MGYVKPLGGYPTGPATVSEGDPSVWFPHLTEPAPVGFALLWLVVAATALGQSLAVRRGALQHHPLAPPRAATGRLGGRAVGTVALLLLVLYWVALQTGWLSIFFNYAKQEFSSHREYASIRKEKEFLLNRLKPDTVLRAARAAVISDKLKLSI
jgi:hypothetical protein